MNKITIGMISLGCPRNIVDSELILGKLSSKGYIIKEDVDKSDIAIINTCAFIEDAKREALDIIIDAAELKKAGRIKKLVVCGCLGQRYADELKKDIPEIDAILGIDAFRNIEKAIRDILKGKHFQKINAPKIIQEHKDKRYRVTPPHYAYVKIAEGCRNRCSYCAIYAIRGDYRSRTIPSIVSEIKEMVPGRRISELDLIAQDITSYGIDRYGSLKLPELLRQICALKRAHWIRILYTHPRHFTDELIEVIAKESSICKYIDLPVQHISDNILKRMNRGIMGAQIEELIQKIRAGIPGVALRTSVIVGFPGETEKDFNELCDFIRRTKFERLGAFIYSREEKTAAYHFKGQVNEKIKKERLDIIMKLQQEVSAAVNEGFLGKTLEVLIDEADLKGKPQKAGTVPVYIGRTQYDAPEVDGQVYVHSKKVLKPGDFVDVKITDTLEYDLVGRTL